MKYVNIGKIKLTKISCGTYKLSSPRCRFASFDLCYGYFQTHRGCLTIDMERSCLHLWSYLASWGMFRNSKLFSDCSMKVMEDIVFYLSGLEDSDWDLDLGLDARGCIDSIKSERIVKIYEDLSKIIENIYINCVIVGVSPTITLITKIMLGTLGCIPAFDKNFKNALGTSNSSLTRDVLYETQLYYGSSPTCSAADTGSAVSINPNTKIKVINFNGKSTELFYSRAKVLDMIGFSSVAKWPWQIV